MSRKTRHLAQNLPSSLFRLPLSISIRMPRIGPLVPSQGHTANETPSRVPSNPLPNSERGGIDSERLSMPSVAQSQTIQSPLTIHLGHLDSASQNPPFTTLGHTIFRAHPDAQDPYPSSGVVVDGSTLNPDHAATFSDGAVATIDNTGRLALKPAPTTLQLHPMSRMRLVQYRSRL